MAIPLDEDRGTVAGPVRKPTSPLEDVLDTHINIHERVFELISVLETRLNPILRPTQPSTDDGMAKKAEDEEVVQSDLVQSLHGSNHRLRSYANRIGNLLDRLEI